MRKPRQRSAARISAAYMSLSTARSPNACGITLVRRRSSPNSRKQVGRTNRTPVREQEAQVRNACFEVILQARQRRRQGCAGGRRDVVPQHGGERRGGGLMAGNGVRRELRPLILGHPALQVAQLVGE